MTADTRLAREDGTIMRDTQSRVPIRTIAATIGIVLLTHRTTKGIHTGPRHQPGRPRPSPYSRRRQCVTTAMSDAGHDRTRLGSHEYVHARQ
jgi:hypothetical protein